MVDKNQIDGWLKEGVITEAQAGKMVADTEEAKRDESSNRFVTVISSIGAVLIGLAAILFVAVNWDELSAPFKIVLLLGSTFGSYYIGYLFAYKRKSYPKVGAALIFLGALLFGASVFLIAQIYNINSSIQTTANLLLIWLVGILPLVYAFLSKPIAYLSSLLFIVVSYVFIITGMETPADTFSVIFGDSRRFFFDMWIIILTSGLLLFAIGGMHYASEKLKGIARVYRLVGLRISLLATFVLTMNALYRVFGYMYNYYDVPQNFAPNLGVTKWLLGFSIIAIILSLLNVFYNFVRTKLFVIENLLAIGLLILAGCAYFFISPTSSQLFHVLFTITFIGVIIATLYIGYKNLDMTVVNKALSYTSLFIAIKYFEWFWDALNPYIFFFIGGLILILGGIALERKRKQIKSKIALAKATTYAA